MTLLPDDFKKAIKIVTDLLSGENYCIRGSTGLILQGLDMNTNDIDVLCDSATALKCNELLSAYLKEEVSYKESAQFKSWFGKFTVENVQVEVMGDWQIYSEKSGWSPKYTASEKTSLSFEGGIVYVTPVVLELEMFAAMGRWTAFQKIKKQLPQKEGTGQPSLF